MVAPMEEVLPGVFHWTTVHPRIHMEVSSYWLEHAGILVEEGEQGRVGLLELTPLVYAHVPWFSLRYHIPPLKETTPNGLLLLVHSYCSIS